MRTALFIIISGLSLVVLVWALTDPVVDQALIPITIKDIKTKDKRVEIIPASHSIPVPAKESSTIESKVVTQDNAKDESTPTASVPNPALEYQQVSQTWTELNNEDIEKKTSLLNTTESLAKTNPDANEILLREASQNLSTPNFSTLKPENLEYGLQALRYYLYNEPDPIRGKRNTERLGIEVLGLGEARVPASEEPTSPEPAPSPE